MDIADPEAFATGPGDQSVRKTAIEDYRGRSAVIYLDTSALVKRFINEKGSALVQSLVQGTNAVATAKIANSEKAICRKRSTLWLAGSLKVIGWLTFEWSYKMRSWLWPAI